MDDSYVAEARDNIPRDPLFGAGRAPYNLSGTSCKLLEEDTTTYQERLASYLKKMLKRSRNVFASYLTKMLQCIRNVLQVTWRRCSNVSGISGKLLEEEFFNVSGTSCKWLDEHVTTYQERLASYLKKMLQPIRNMWQVTFYQEHVSPSVTLKVSFHHAGPLNSPHFPAPCAQVLP